MKKLVKVLASAAALTLIIGASTGYGGDSSSKAANASQEKITVRFGSSAGENAILLGVPGVAQELGYIAEELDKEGYGLEVIGFVNGVAVNEAFATNSIDISTLGDVPNAVGLSNEIGTVWLGNGLSSYNSEIVARKESGITTVKDLEGKKLGYGVGTTTQYLWDSVAQEYDVDVSKIEVVNLSGTHLVNAFLTGDVDAIIHGANFTRTLEKEEGGVIVLSTADYPQWAPQDTVTGRKAFAKEHPDAVVAIFRALIRARDAVIADPNKYYVALSGRQIEANPDLGPGLYNRDNGKFENLNGLIGQQNIERQQRLADFLESQGRIVNRVDISKNVDTSFYEKALSELGKK